MIRSILWLESVWNESWCQRYITLWGDHTSEYSKPPQICSSGFVAPILHGFFSAWTGADLPGVSMWSGSTALRRSFKHLGKPPGISKSAGFPPSWEASHACLPACLAPSCHPQALNPPYTAIYIFFFKVHRGSMNRTPTNLWGSTVYIWVCLYQSTSVPNSPYEKLT